MAGEEGLWPLAWHRAGASSPMARVSGRRGALWLDQALPDGVPDEHRPVVQVELLHDVGPVSLALVALMYSFYAISWFVAPSATILIDAGSAGGLHSCREAGRR